jgi:hypothetical protein
MRKIIGTIGATLAIGIFTATFAVPAGADVKIDNTSPSLAVSGSSGDRDEEHSFVNTKGGKSFVGPADDPFFVDLGPVFDGLLTAAAVEPDLDADGVGDETQDPDGGGLGTNWEDNWFEDFMSFVSDWFEDFGSGDELDRTMPTAVVDGINIDKPGRPIGGSGNAGGGRDDVSGFNPLVNSEPVGGSPMPTTDLVLTASLT